MSKVGQRTIRIPENITIKNEANNISITGPKGEINLDLPTLIKVKINGDEISVERVGNHKKAKAFHGLYRKLISNMVTGVTDGFQKKLDFKGVGFKAEINENNLILNVGFSHPVEYKIQEGVEIKVEKNIITVSGIDRQKVGQVAAEIRAIKPVEPYKGKGIKYIDEIPRRKLGKAAKAIIGGAQ